MNDANEIQDWLRRLSWSLAAIPSPEREDIVAEARAHIEEAIAQGQTPAAVLSGFGEPDEYARAFIDQMEVARAMGSQATSTMLATVTRRVHRSAVAALAAVVLFLLAVVVFTAVSVALFKLGDPAHTGLWHGPHAFFIGRIDDPSKAKELLGNWLLPLAALACALSWLIGRFVLLWTLRQLARSR